MGNIFGTNTTELSKPIMTPNLPIKLSDIAVSTTRNLKLTDKDKVSYREEGNKYYLNCDLNVQNFDIAMLSYKCIEISISKTDYNIYVSKKFYSGHYHGIWELIFENYNYSNYIFLQDDNKSIKLYLRLDGNEFDIKNSKYKNFTIDKLKEFKIRIIGSLIDKKQEIVLGSSFEGMDIDSSGGWIPPDPTIAVGPNDIMTAVNSSIAINSKITLTQTALISVPTLFSSVGSNGVFIGDSYCLYDQMVGRFIFITFGVDYENVKGYFFIAVSKKSILSSPPNVDDFWVYRTSNSYGSTEIFADYPKVGYDKNAYYISSVNFQIKGPYQETGIYAYDKNILLNGPSSTTVVTTALFKYLKHPVAIPAQMYGNIGPNHPMLFISADTFLTHYLTLYAIFDVLSPSPTIYTTRITPTYFSAPKPISQPPPAGPSSTLSTIDWRIMGASFRNGKLWAAHNITDSLTTTFRSSIRWYEIGIKINYAKKIITPTINQEETIILTPLPTDECCFPRIATDKKGNMAISFTISGSSRNPSIGLTGRKKDDIPNTTNMIQVVKDGHASYQITAGVQRWGDYSGLAIDPNDDETFWLYNEYPKNVSNPSGIWTTHAQSFKFA